MTSLHGTKACEEEKVGEKFYKPGYKKLYRNAKSMNEAETAQCKPPIYFSTERGSGIHCL